MAEKSVDCESDEEIFFGIPSHQEILKRRTLLGENYHSPSVCSSTPRTLKPGSARKAALPDLLKKPPSTSSKTGYVGVDESVIVMENQQTSELDVSKDDSVIVISDDESFTQHDEHNQQMKNKSGNQEHFNSFTRLSAAVNSSSNKSALDSIKRDYDSFCISDEYVGNSPKENGKTEAKQGDPQTSTKDYVHDPTHHVPDEIGDYKHREPENNDNDTLFDTKTDREISKTSSNIRKCLSTSFVTSNEMEKSALEMHVDKENNLDGDTNFAPMIHVEECSDLHMSVDENDFSQSTIPAKSETSSFSLTDLGSSLVSGNSSGCEQSSSEYTRSIDSSMEGDKIKTGPNSLDKGKLKPSTKIPVFQSSSLLRSPKPLPTPEKPKANLKVPENIPKPHSAKKDKFKYIQSPIRAYIQGSSIEVLKSSAAIKENTTENIDQTKIECNGTKKTCQLPVNKTPFKQAKNLKPNYEKSENQENISPNKRHGALTPSVNKSGTVANETGTKKVVPKLRPITGIRLPDTPRPKLPPNQGSVEKK